MELPFNDSRIDSLSSSLIGHGRTFDMLRDDLIHPIVSGNKWRKLKYIVQTALSNNKTHLVSFGGAYSNHLVALAFAGKYFGLRTSAFVRGDEERAPNHYERICLENGMELIKTERSSFRNKQALFDDTFGGKQDAMMVGEGGDHPMALPGCEEMWQEIGDAYDFVILSLGTGTTMEGLLKALNNSRTKVLGISSLKNNHDLDKRMAGYDSERFKIYHDFHRGKYAKSDPELIRFIQSFYQETGIKTDTVYTGKMLMAVDNLIQEDIIQSQHKILCIHTGGLLAFPA